MQVRRIQSAALQRGLPSLLDRAQPGDVYEITDARRRKPGAPVLIRAFLVVAHPDQEVTVNAQG